MEKAEDRITSKDVVYNHSINTSADNSTLPVVGAGLGREFVFGEFSEGNNAGIRSKRITEEGVHRQGNSAVEGDYVTISGLNDLGVLNGHKDVHSNIRSTQSSDEAHSALHEDNMDSSERSDSSRSSVGRPDQSRPRSLSKISEMSHIGSDLETKDDLYLTKTNTGRMSHIDNPRTISETSLAGSGDELLGYTHNLSYDAQVSNGHIDKNANGQESAITSENDNIIVSGNIRNGQDSSTPNASHYRNIQISPISKHAALTATDVASESTPKPSTAAVFKFPSLKPDTKNSTDNIPSPRNKTDHQFPTSQNGHVSKANDSPSFLTEAVVHTNTAPPVEEIPLSLRNLVFLTKPEPPVSGAIEDSSAAAKPGYLITSDRKRSNLKKPNMPAAGSNLLLSAPNANTSFSSSTGSINALGYKKSIKWGKDVPASQKSQNEPQVSVPQDTPKPQNQPSSKESTNRDSYRKIPGGQASNITDKKDPENITSEAQDRKASRGSRGDKTSLDEINRGSSRVSSGYSTPVRSSGPQELAANDVVRALRGVKGKVRTEDKDASFSEEIDLGLSSPGLLSSTGGMSTPGDLTPKGYLTDNEDTFTSFDELERRDKTAMYGLASSSAADVETSPLRDSVVSDDVFKPQTAQNRNVKGKTGGCIPDNLRHSLAMILSSIYGIIIVVLGLVLPLSETFANPEHPYFFEVFYLYLYAVSLAFLVYVYTYLLRKERSLLLALPKTISRTLSRTFSRSSVRSRTSVASEKSGSVAGKPLVRGNSNLSVNTPSYRKRRKIAYNPDVSKHTGSFYLRVGVIGFGIGSMIHSALTFGHYFEVIHLDSHCSDAIQAIKPLAHLCFTFVQMYFIFMNSKMCVHKYKTLARFGLMHMSCTNICVWLRSVVVETLQVIKVDRRDTYNAMVKAYEEYKQDAEDDSDEQEAIQSLEEYMQEHQIGTMSEINCRWDAMLGKIVESSSVYLYPCIIEYSLVCACVLYVMWSNVGDGNTGNTMVKRTDSCSDVDTLDSDDDSEDENAHHRMSVDCAASSKGLFLGILLFVIAVVCIVCFYVLTSVKSHVTIGTLLGHISEEIILVVAFIATAIAAFQMRHMRFTGHRKVGIEEILSLVSISGLGLYGIWSIIAAVFHLDTLHGRLTLITNLFMLVQAGSQATFTLATLRASARNHEQLKGKPGRQCVTFLIICNFALWVVNTFETQRIEYNQTQVNFYGTTAWAIFSHISVPLGIYFRFNATVNLSIVWKKAWKKKEPEGQSHKNVPHSTH